MSSPAIKRQRTGAGPPAALRAPLSPEQIEVLKSKISQLPAATLQAIVLSHVSSPVEQTLSESVENAHAQILQRERNRVISFDHFSKEAWYLLNKKYARLSGSKEYEMTFEVASDIGEMLESIRSETSEHSSMGTKLNAVETMRKIFKSTLLTGGQMGKEVTQHCYGWDDRFLEVLGLFTSGDLDRLRDWDDGRGPWIDKLRELSGYNEDYGDVFPRLQEAIDLVSGETGESEDDESENNDEDEGDEADELH